MFTDSSKLGPYSLIRELARGGSRVVYEGVRDDSGQHDAILALEPGADADERECFAAEAKLLATLDHPNVAKVFSLELEGPRPYAVEDLLPGGDLLARLARGPFSVADSVALMLKVARGLEHAHGRGVLHRDLRPQTVLFDATGEPKLVDFGLALCADGSRPLTSSGAIIGSPLYAAPERVQPGSLLDARTDVYGLGALLYAALTGGPPVQAGRTREATCAAVASAPPKPLHAPDRVPPAVSAVCSRALERDPAARFNSAEEFVQALEATRS